MDEADVRGVRVFLVDDHPLMRSGLSLLLAEVGHEVCGEAGNRAELLERIDGSGAQVALVDLSLAEESGLDLTGRHVRPGPRLVLELHGGRPGRQRAHGLPPGRRAPGLGDRAEPRTDGDHPGHVPRSGGRQRGEGLRPRSHGLEPGAWAAWCAGRAAAR